MVSEISPKRQMEPLIRRSRMVMADGFALGPHYTRHVERENTITKWCRTGFAGPLFL